MAILENGASFAQSPCYSRSCSPCKVSSCVRYATGAGKMAAGLVAKIKDTMLRLRHQGDSIRARPTHRYWGNSGGIIHARACAVPCDQRVGRFADDQAARIAWFARRFGGVYPGDNRCSAFGFARAQWHFIKRHALHPGIGQCAAEPVGHGGGARANDAARWRRRTDGAGQRANDQHHAGCL